MVPAQTQTAPKSSAALIAEIREKQRETARYLDTLSDAAGTVPRAGTRPEPFADQASLAVFGSLSPAQERVCQAALQKTREMWEDNGQPCKVAAPFTAAELAQELAAANPEIKIAAVQQTLGILEVLGVVVRAHLPASAKNKDALPYYRVATPWDEPAAPSPAPPAQPNVP